RSRPSPLALYFFTQNKNHETKILDQVSFGGASINDCLMQTASPYLPFGGIGQSGMGHYHGKYSFETFSHLKSIYKKTFLIDLKLECPPHTPNKLWWAKQVFKI